ncbi:MAG TPA: hypothetical protein VGM32_15725 [Rhodopila sp.]
MPPLSVRLDRRVFGNPGKRAIGLNAGKFAECGRGDRSLTRHAGRGGEHAVGADEIGALADTRAGRRIASL